MGFWSCYGLYFRLSLPADMEQYIPASHLNVVSSLLANVVQCVHEYIAFCICFSVGVIRRRRPSQSGQDCLVKEEGWGSRAAACTTCGGTGKQGKVPSCLPFTVKWEYSRVKAVRFHLNGTTKTGYTDMGRRFIKSIVLTKDTLAQTLQLSCLRVGLCDITKCITRPQTNVFRFILSSM